MGRIVSFSEFHDYYRKLVDIHGSVGTILDTNILIALTYEVKANHDEVRDFLEHIESLGVRFHATVNTKSEFLDFHRRLRMTEHLRDLVEPNSKLKISKAARAQIQVQSGQLTRRESQGGKRSKQRLRAKVFHI